MLGTSSPIMQSYRMVATLKRLDGSGSNALVTPIATVEKRSGIGFLKLTE